MSLVTRFPETAGLAGDQGTIELGSEAHKQLFCRTLLDTHDPYKPEVLDWPALDKRTCDRIASLPIWRRPWFELKVVAVWIVLILERISLSRGMGNNSRAQENNFTLRGSQELGVEISFTELAEICLIENDRRLVRPRLALRLAGRRAAHA